MTCPCLKIWMLLEFVRMDVFQEVNTAVTEMMKDLMTECAEYAERYKNVIQMFDPLMRNVERLNDEMEKMAVAVGRQNDDDAANGCH